MTITITAVNDAPIANDDSLTVAKGETQTQLDNASTTVLNNDSDPEDGGLNLTVSLISGPTNASSFTLGLDGTFSYTHDGSATTSDSFVYEATDSGGLSDQATVTINVTDPSNVTMHVADLDGSSTSQGREWTAFVEIEVRDSLGSPVDSATVSGSWSLSGSGVVTSICTTGTAGPGRCQVQNAGIRKRDGTVMFTVGNVSNGLSYIDSDNDDPDGDSDGTVITVAKP